MFLGKARCRVVCVVHCHLGVLKTRVSMCVHPHTCAWVGSLRKEKKETLGDSVLLQGRAGQGRNGHPDTSPSDETH